MEKLPIRIVGDTTVLDKYLSIYLQQKAIVENAEKSKKESSMAVLQIENNAGTYETELHKFTVVGAYESETVSVADMKKECPEVYQILVDKGLIKKRTTTPYITGVKVLKGIKV